MAVFKSYDIRGIFPDQIDASLGLKIGVSLGRYISGLSENAQERATELVVGRDMRKSAPEMTEALIEGLRKTGCHVIDIGLVTTPCIYFAIQHLGTDGGIMCTASHNPPEYIGFKVSREFAIPISYSSGLREVEAGLEEPAPDVPAGELSSTDLTELYLDFLAEIGQDLRPLRIAADASNGMAGKYLADLFERLPCELEGIHLELDGSFPNHEADPLKPENLQDVSELVRRTGSAIGFCFDGDGDRVAIVDEKGQIVGCDLITALIAQDVLEKEPGKPVTYDLRSSKIVREVITELGGEAIRTRVGHSHVKQCMRKRGAIFGGELSGHYYFRLKAKETYYADSALVAMMRLLNILAKTEKPVSELIAPLRKYFHTGEINYNVADKDAALAEVKTTFADGRQDELDGVTVEYDDWWLNVRQSNTEPLVRLTLEGDTPRLRDTNYQKVHRLLSKFGSRV